MKPDPDLIAYLRALHAFNNLHAGLLQQVKQLREWVQGGEIEEALAFLDSLIKGLEDLR